MLPILGGIFFKFKAFKGTIKDCPPNIVQLYEVEGGVGHSMMQNGECLICVLSMQQAQTEHLGFLLGGVLQAGDVLALEGDLGSGKTVFVKGLVRALESSEEVTSPTFSIVNHYPTSPPVFHFDVYRVHQTEELFHIGFEEYLQGDGIVVIEWAGLIEAHLPQNYLQVSIEKLDDSKRKITLQSRGNPLIERFLHVANLWKEGVA